MTELDQVHLKVEEGRSRLQEVEVSIYLNKVKNLELAQTCRLHALTFRNSRHKNSYLMFAIAKARLIRLVSHCIQRSRL